MMPILLSSGFTLNPEMMLGIVTICFTAVELLRTFKKDTKGDASCLATVIAKLESIQSSMTDIKADINTMEKESRALGERVTKMEESLSSLWKYYESLHNDVKDFSHHQ